MNLNNVQLHEKIREYGRQMELIQCVLKVVRRLRRTISKMIDIRLKLASDLHRINADPAQMEQAVMNLVTSH